MVRNQERVNEPTATTGTDSAEVSQNDAFVNTAVHAVLETPAVRQDKIAAAKQALADGTLGQDAVALADAVINHMLDDDQQ